MEEVFKIRYQSNNPTFTVVRDLRPKLKAWLAVLSWVHFKAIELNNSTHRWQQVSAPTVHENEALAEKNSPLVFFRELTNLETVKKGQMKKNSVSYRDRIFFSNEKVYNWKSIDDEIENKKDIFLFEFASTVAE